MEYRLPSGAIQRYKHVGFNPAQKAQTADVTDAICFVVLKRELQADGTYGTAVHWESSIEPEEALSHLVRTIPHIRESFRSGPNVADN